MLILITWLRYSSIMKLFFFTLFLLYSLEGSQYVKLRRGYFRQRVVMVHPLGSGVSVWINWNSLETCLFSAIYLFIQSFIYFSMRAWIYIYWILWFIIHYFVLLFKLFRLWLLGTLSLDSCIAITFSHAYMCVCWAVPCFLALPAPQVYFVCFLLQYLY